MQAAMNGKENEINATPRLLSALDRHLRHDLLRQAHPQWPHEAAQHAERIESGLTLIPLLDPSNT